jgi:hypothetical protein
MLAAARAEDEGNIDDEERRDKEVLNRGDTATRGADDRSDNETIGDSREETDVEGSVAPPSRPRVSNK